MTVTLNLTLNDVPIRTLNAVGGWKPQNTHRQATRTVVKNRAKKQPVKFDVPVSIRVTLLAPDNYLRDPDNLAETGKPIIDGLVDAKWIKKDDWRHVTAVTFSTFPAAEVNQEPGWVVTVTPSKALYAVDGGAA